MARILTFAYMYRHAGLPSPLDVMLSAHGYFAGLMVRAATNTPVQNPLYSGEDGTLSMSVLHHAPDEFDGGLVKSMTHAVDIIDEVATNITGG